MEVNSLSRDRQRVTAPVETEIWNRSPAEISVPNNTDTEMPEFIQRIIARKRSERNQLDQYFEEANRRLEPVFREFDRRIHSGTNRMIVAVIDTESRELIREIPTEESLDLIEKMWHLTGLFFDKQF